MLAKSVRTLAFLVSGMLFFSPMIHAEGLTIRDVTCRSISTDAIYPEGIEYDENREEFILGSFRMGQVYRVDREGRARLFIDNENIITAMGVRVDKPRNRLLVVISDMGVSERRSESGPRSIARLGEFDLETGDLIRITDLAALRPPAEQHIANDVAIDREGNAYVTDSLAAVIYKVDVNGVASILVEDAQLVRGNGFNGNGILFHPDGFLLVAKKNEGAIFKIPLGDTEDLQALTPVQTDQAYVGADGLILLDEHTLAIVTNISGSVVSERVYVVETEDEWQTSTTRSVEVLPAGSYPTTGVMVQDTLYVASSGLNRLMQSYEAEVAAGFSRTANLTAICHPREIPADDQ